MKALPQHIQKQLDGLSPEQRAHWEAHAAPHTLPEHVEVALRADDGILLRGHYQDRDGAMATITSSVDLVAMIHVLAEMATLKDFQPVLLADWYENATEDQIDTVLIEDGNFSYLCPVALRGGEIVPAGKGAVLISPEEMGDLLDHLEAIIPQLREMTGGDVPAALHALPAKRGELAWHLDQAGETMQSLAEALRA